ncbi:MAG: hypothetical protein LH630_04980, partial [Actinomycetia bacterium]|nr:hypothetical protein [Actinomycetes bacterium]
AHTVWGPVCHGRGVVVDDRAYFGGDELDLDPEQGAHWIGKGWVEAVPVPAKGKATTRGAAAAAKPARQATSKARRP